MNTTDPSTDTADEAAVEARLRAAFDATADLPDSGRPLPATTAPCRRRPWLAPVGAVAATAAVVAGAVALSPAARHDPESTAASATSASAFTQQRTADGRAVWTVDAFVSRDTDRHQLTLCVGVMLYSIPGRCTGPAVQGWQGPSPSVEGPSAATYRLVGTFAPDPRQGDPSRPGTFTLVRPPEPAGLPSTPSAVPATPPPGRGVPELPSPLDEDLGSPCRVPAGGWTTPDPTRATRADRDGLVRAAQARPDFADWWLDPSTGVVNVAVTGDPPAADTALRPRWGGPLCVSRQAVPRTRLRTVYADLGHRVSGLLTASLRQGHIALRVVADDGTLQADLDRRYGPGVVRVTSALRPYTGDGATPDGGSSPTGSGTR